MKTFTLPFLASAILLGGCASAPGGDYGKPYALFQTEGRMGMPGQVPAYLFRIDGKPYVLGRSDPVEPGMHEIEFSISGPVGTNAVGGTFLKVDAKPCTRYFFAAKRDSPTATQWQALISGTEPIGECAKRFGTK
jgi:hypothetical protein